MFVTKSLTYGCVVAGVLYVTKPMLLDIISYWIFNGETLRALPLKADFLVDTKKSPMYEFAYLLQACLVYYIIVCTVSINIDLKTWLKLFYLGRNRNHIFPILSQHFRSFGDSSGHHWGYKTWRSCRLSLSNHSIDTETERSLQTDIARNFCGCGIDSMLHRRSSSHVWWYRSNCGCTFSRCIHFDWHNNLHVCWSASNRFIASCVRSTLQNR